MGSIINDWWDERSAGPEAPFAAFRDNLAKIDWDALKREQEQETPIIYWDQE